MMVEQVVLQELSQDFQYLFQVEEVAVVIHLVVMLVVVVDLMV